MTADDAGQTGPGNSDPAGDVEPGAVSPGAWDLDEYGVPAQRRPRRAGWRAAACLACAIIALAADISVLPSGSAAVGTLHGAHRAVALCGGLIALIPPILAWANRREIFKPKGQKTPPSSVIIGLSALVCVAVAFYLLPAGITGNRFALGYGGD